jgi:Protein of unknown function (DUF1304)
MCWTASQITVGSIGVVHLLIMVGELYPWNCPIIMNSVLGKWQPPLHLSPDNKHFVSMVVHNAGIYNGIVAVALIVAASYGSRAFGIQGALLIGVVVAGVFGFATLTKLTIVQAILGAIGLIVVWLCG